MRLTPLLSPRSLFFIGLLAAFPSLVDPVRAADNVPPSQGAVFRDIFSVGSSDAGWKIDKGANAFGDIKRSTDPQAPGFLVTAPGPVSAVAEWQVGNAPFDFWFDATISDGTKAAWRYNGIVVALSSAPIGEMTGTDVSFSGGFFQGGAQCGIERGPFYQPGRDAKTAQKFNYSGAAKRFDLNMAGAGGEAFSVGWPKKTFGGTKLRCHIQRLPGDQMHFELYTSDGDPSKPWWVGDSPIPADLATASIRCVSIFTNEEDANLSADRARHYPATVVTGRISAIQGWLGDAARPVIDGYATGPGGITEGKAIVLTGSNFSKGATVYINGNACQTEVVSPAEARATATGLNSQGANRLQLANENGLFATYDPGIYAGLCLAGVEPREDLPAGGSVVTLRGSGFDAATRVTFNGQPAEVVGKPNSDSMQVKVPPGVAGLATVAASSGGQAFAGSPPFGYAPHPYMLFKGPEGLASMKARFNDPGFAPYRNAILAETDKAIAGMNDLALGKFGQINEVVLGSAFAYAMTGDPKYKEAAWKTYKIQFEGGDGIFPQKQWNYPGRLQQALDKDEFLVMTGDSFALMYDALFDQLTPEMRAKMERYLDDYANYFRARVAGGDWWYGGGSNPSNTIPVGSGDSGTIALALRYSTPNADSTLDLAAKNIVKFYKAIQDDGGCTEGNMYWNYGLGAQLSYGLFLQNATGNDKGLLSDPKFPKMVDFVATQLGGDGNMFVFNDTQPWINGVIPEAFAGSRFDQPLMRWACDEIARRVATGSQFPEVGRPSYIIPAFLFRDSKPMIETVPPLPTVGAMKVLNWGVMRSSPQDFRSGLVVGVKGVGGTQTHHAEEDAGSFVVQSRGESFLIHPGYFQGTAPEHNLPIIGDFKETGKYGAILNIDATAPLSDIWEEGNLRTITVDATKSYNLMVPGEPDSAANNRRTLVERKVAALVRRVLVLDADKAVVALDQVEPANPGDQITSFYQCGFVPTLLPGGFRIEGKNSDMAVLLDGPQSTLSIEGPFQWKQDWVFAKTNVQWRRIHATPYTYTPGQPRVTVMLPLAKGDPVPAISVKRYAGSISIAIPGAQPVSFTKNGDLWQTVKQ